MNEWVVLAPQPRHCLWFHLVFPNWIHFFVFICGRLLHFAVCFPIAWKRDFGVILEIELILNSIEIFSFFLCQHSCWLVIFTAFDCIVIELANAIIWITSILKQKNWNNSKSHRKWNMKGNNLWNETSMNQHYFYESVFPLKSNALYS